MNTIIDYIKKNALKRGNDIALVIENDSITYEQLYLNSKNIAVNLKKQGISNGDVVSLYMNNSIEYVLCVIGIFMSGGTANPINPMLKAAELDSILVDANPKIVITDFNLEKELSKTQHLESKHIINVYNSEDYLQFLNLGITLNGYDDKEEVIVSPNTDPCLLCYSSGTTGKPKGIIHSHSSVLSQAFASIRRFRFNKDDIIFYTLPLSHLFGLNVILFSALLAGSKQHIYKLFNTKQVIEELLRSKANIFVGVPTMFSYLCNYSKENYQLTKNSNLKVGISAGSPINRSTLEAFKKIFNVDILNAYGITEAAGVVCASNRKKFSDEPIGSVGMPFPRNVIKIISKNGEEIKNGKSGEIIVKCPHLMIGYKGNPYETSKALDGEYLHTGDLGYLDENGYLFVKDRIKDVIISGGYNIFPTEIENVVNNFPSVKESALFPNKDELRGEIPILAVVFKGKETKLKELMEYCKENIAWYKIPKDIIVLDEIPKNVTGKISRRKLSEIYENKKTTKQCKVFK